MGRLFKATAFCAAGLLAASFASAAVVRRFFNAGRRPNMTPEEKMTSTGYTEMTDYSPAAYGQLAEAAGSRLLKCQFCDETYHREHSLKSHLTDKHNYVEYKESDVLYPPLPSQTGADNGRVHFDGVFPHHTLLSEDPSSRIGFYPQCTPKEGKMVYRPFRNVEEETMAPFAFFGEEGKSHLESTFLLKKKNILLGLFSEDVPCRKIVVTVQHNGQKEEKSLWLPKDIKLPTVRVAVDDDEGGCRLLHEPVDWSGEGAVAPDAGLMVTVTDGKMSARKRRLLGKSLKLAKLAKMVTTVEAGVPLSPREGKDQLLFLPMYNVVREGRMFYPPVVRNLAYTKGMPCKIIDVRA